MISNFIHQSKSILNLKECQNIIDFYESKSEYHKEGTSGEILDVKNKKCTEMFVVSSALSDQEEFIPLSLGLKKSINEYKIEYPFINRVQRWETASIFKIQKYLPHEAYFATHCENNGHLDGEVDRRMIAWMCYLNDVTDGGETEFPTQGKKIAPRAGDVLLWPAYWTHPHHGIPSPSQMKYIVTGWYNYL
jgi:hypothetical protein